MPFTVVHVITNPEVGAKEIPLLLSGKTVDSTDNVGSGNYSKIPLAVATGGGYDDDAFNLMREASNGTKVVPWLRPDKSKLKDGPPLDDIEAFGKNTAVRVKKTLDDLGVGKGEEKDEWKTEVYLF